MNDLQSSETPNLLMQGMLGMRQIDLSHFVQVEFDCPADKVWPYLSVNRLGDWTPQNCYHESGEVDQEGSTFKSYLKDESGADMPFPVFRCKTVTRIPDKLWVLMLSIQYGPDSTETFFGYDVFVFDEQDAKTALTYLQILKLGHMNVPDEAMAVFQQGQSAYLGHMFDELKALAEA